MIEGAKVEAALEKYTTLHEHDGKPYRRFPPDVFRYSEVSARAIVWACLELGVPVSPTLTGETWATLVGRIVRIEDRLDRVEAMARHGV